MAHLINRSPNLHISGPIIQVAITLPKSILDTYKVSGTKPPSEAYLDSLNLIDVVFQKDKKVRRAWKEYYDSLNGSSPHFENRNSFLLDLLSEMAESLGYKHLKQTEIDKFYSPQYYGTQQTNQQILFQEFLRVLIASKSMGETYSEAEAEKHKEEMRKNLNLQ